MKRSSSVEHEQDDIPQASFLLVLAPVDPSFNTSIPIPELGPSAIRSSARLREKRKRDIEDEDAKENVPVGGHSYDLDDKIDSSEPGPSRPEKRRRLQLKELEEVDEEDHIDSQSDDEDAVNDEGPAPGPSTLTKKCLLDGCQHELSGIHKQDWDHMLKADHFKKNTDGLYPCTYPKCPGFGRVSGCKGKQAVQRHVMSEHWLDKLWCTWPGCGKFYHRDDVLQKHLKRHTW